MTDTQKVNRLEMLIRAAVVSAYFGGGRVAFVGSIRSILRDAVTITNKDLRDAATRSLRSFAWRQWRTINTIQGGGLYMAVTRATGGGGYANRMTLKAAAEQIQSAALTGVPLGIYQQEYYRDHIKPTIDRLVKQAPLDPDDVSGRNSLRGRAEMEVRYEYNQEQLEEAKKSPLVICSTHSNCSDRCRRWQGRVYSTDGTTGIAPDGRKYIPLETATDIYYTTKAGRTYKNGLLGFNCRHTLVAYKNGLSFPRFTAAEERAAYALNNRQRALERAVRHAKVKETTLRGVNADAHRAAEEEVKRTRNRLKAFCAKNDIVFDETRIQY